MAGSRAAATACPVLEAVLVERAARCFLLGGRLRKYSLYQTLAGLKFSRIPAIAQCTKHSVTCYTAASIVFEGSNWGDAKVHRHRRRYSHARTRTHTHIHTCPVALSMIPVVLTLFLPSLSLSSPVGAAVASAVPGATGRGLRDRADGDATARRASPCAVADAEDPSICTHYCGWRWRGCQRRAIRRALWCNRYWQWRWQWHRRWWCSRVVFRLRLSH